MEPNMTDNKDHLSAQPLAAEPTSIAPIAADSNAVIAPNAQQTHPQVIGDDSTKPTTIKISQHVRFRLLYPRVYRGG
jgi:hypothetical protein